ncbi:MAG: ATP-dependent DNA helicase RecG, partial [Alphaproteobacteria bacterium]
ATLTVRVDAHDPPPPGSRRPYRVLCSDSTGSLILTFFHANGEFLRRQLPEGEIRVVSGTVEHYRDAVQISHPDHIVSPGEIETLPQVEPVYPLTAGLTPKLLAKAMKGALERLPTAMPDWLDPAYARRQDWPDWTRAVRAAHAPEDAGDLGALSPARARLAYDELLANQLALALVRARMRRMPGRGIAGDGRLRKRVEAALPFTLTTAQRMAIAEIEADMAAPFRMLRLLQGDVGSGKTLVAAFAILTAVEAGSQAALMVPTEILARQHAATLGALLTAAGVHVALLTGREKGGSRDKILAGLADGSVDLVIGTHALFQDAVQFRDLALAVIDEQHRFGVHQRVNLTAKGKAVDCLVMTATPIPRTLLMTAYGDLECSQIREKPAGRKPIETRTLPANRVDEVVDALPRAIADGAKVYWVCPLVEESEASDLAAAEARHRALAARFGDTVELVHGRMRGADRDAAMRRFAEGSSSILVATTVIEVGVDVPAATVMVIEQAERFGLAQLHQLRGRIGRGDRPSNCLLVYGTPLSATARARLAILRDSEDGFRIAEEDLRLRGGGEVLGTRQSGLPEFRLADLAVHGDLLAAARDDAKLILERDPDLKSERGRALRVLLYLFERDAAVLTLRSG